MALPSIMRKLFRNDGYGPLLKPEIIPFTSDLANKAADVAASTTWVKDLVNPAFIYVDYYHGSDSNDGLTPNSRVKSIAHALEIAKLRFGEKHVISLGNGAVYDENVNIDGLNVYFALEGNVTIGGTLSAYNSTVLIAGSDKKIIFSVNNTQPGSLVYGEHSRIAFGCIVSVDIHSGSLSNIFYADHVSDFYFGGAVNIYSSINTITNAFIADDNSHLNIVGNTITLNNNNTIKTFIDATHCSSVKCTNSTFNADTSEFFTYVDASSNAAFHYCNFNNVAAKYVMSVTMGSSIHIGYGCYGFLQAKSGGHCIICTSGSCVYVENTALTLKTYSDSTIKSYVFVGYSSSADFMSNHIALSGSVSVANFNIVYVSSVRIPSGTAEGSNRVDRANTPNKPSCRLARNSVIYTNNNSELLGTNTPSVIDNSIYS